MAWLAVDKDGEEVVYETKPERLDDIWIIDEEMGEISIKDTFLILLPGTIEKAIGKPMKWEDEPIEVSYKLSDFKRTPSGIYTI